MLNTAGAATGHGWGLQWGRLAVVAVLYYATARLGLGLAFENTNISPLWPPAGVALAAMLVWGYKMWPAIALAALVANLQNYLAVGVPLSQALPVSLLLMAGNTVEVFAGAWMVRRVKPEGRWFEHPTGVVQFMGLGALSCVIGATVGASTVFASKLGQPNDWSYLWWTWWTGDTAGVHMITPLAVAWSQRLDWGLLRERRNEFCGVLLGLTAVSWGIFGPGELIVQPVYPLAYLLLPFLVWAALRFGRSGATVCLVTGLGIAVWGTTHGHGPFHMASLNESLLLLQTFMSVVAMTVLVLMGTQIEQHQAQEKLEERVRERTAQLTESHHQLTESLGRLQQSEAQRESLTHMVVHDLRTPVNALDYLLQLLGRDEANSPRQREAIELAKQSSATLSRRILNLMEIQNAENDVLQLHRESVLPAALLEEAAAQLRPLAHHKRLTLQTETESQLPHVYIDREKMSRVLQNLLDNAISFSPEGGMIRLHARQLAPTEITTTQADISAPGWIEFSVSDEGPGIAEAEFSRIFEKFGQAGSEKDRQSSTGLGLAYCKMIVEAHGGCILVQSQLGAGSRLLFRLPLGSTDCEERLR